MGAGQYAVELDWCLDHPKITMLVASLIFAATLLLIPFIGGEFMPHLDEGALWVRATMPYTISFEEASRFSPQVRNILMKYPMVTDVGSELGRPDDGTDPTGFFNDEFYVGLKPYSDSSWKGGRSTTRPSWRRISRSSSVDFRESSSTTRSRPKTRWMKRLRGSRARSR